MGKTFEEKLDFLRQCETGYVTDALNLLKIGNCWVEGVAPARTDIPTVVGVAYTSELVLEREPKEQINVYEVVDRCPKGHVLVWAGFGKALVLGENLMTRASNKGLGGVVADAKCRDIKGIRKLPMVVFSEGFSTKLQPTYLKINFKLEQPVSLNGATIHTGDVVVGDDDGVVVIPREKFDDVFHQIEMIAEVENEVSAANREKPDMPVKDFIKLVSKKKNLRQ